MSAPSTPYDAIWAEKWGDLQRYGPVSRHHRRIMASMARGLPVSTLLDVGCGEGSLLAFLAARLGVRAAAGIDVSQEAIAKARETYPAASYVIGDLTPSTFAERFDLVTCADVVEHVEDDVGLLRTVATASRRWVLVATIQGRMRPSEREIGHVRNYARGELADKMRSAGIEPVRTVEWGFPFYSPLFRSAAEARPAQSVSFGRYGIRRRLLCHSLYSLFLLNSSSRGDRVYVLGRT
jgi:trans-aconitate methyltransferase